MENINVKSQLEHFKQLYPDALFLMRSEDKSTYSLYNEDARRAAPSLDITPQPMIGGLDYVVQFPQHALDTYLPKLVRDGFRICIVDHPEQFA